MKVKDLMISIKKFPVVNTKMMLKEALVDMGKTNLGLVCIVNNDFRLLGLFTDGDIRRMLLKNQKPFSAFFVDDVIIHANLNPTTCHPETQIKDAIRIMGKKEIWDLPVVDNDNKLVGLLHLHQAILQII